jgi:hypothetical protein
MEESQEKTIAYLTEVFSGIASYTKLSNKNANPNVNQHLEAFFTELFNVLFEGLNFGHLDLNSINSKGLDILSKDKTIGIQVSADDSLKKVRETIKKVLPLELPLKKLLMVYPTDKKPKRTNIFPKQAFQLEEWSFNDILQKIRGLDEHQLIQIKHLTIKYFPWLNSVKRSFEILEKLYPGYFISELEIPDFQIERKISELLTKEDLGDERNLNNLDPIDLEPYLLEKKRVVLIGESGMGKTNELEKFAIALAEKKEYCPYFESLKNFSDYSSIEELLPEEWDFVPKEKRVLIFDGFDEIGIQFSFKIQSMFKVFIKKHPETLILISSRGSFFFNELNGKLIDFSNCYLHKLTWLEIKEFVHHEYGIDGEEFINSCYTLDLLELAAEPYSLNLLAQEYDSFKDGRKSSSEVLKLVFDKRVEYDLSEHFISSIPNEITKSKIEVALEKIATIITIGGLTQISNEDLCKIITDEQTLSSLRHLLIFEQRGSSNSQWNFEHNKLRDYFAAKRLTRLRFNEIKKLICVPNTSFVLSNWHDSFKFYLDISDSKTEKFNQVIDWLFHNDYQLLVAVNRGKINEKIRFELLKKVVTYYRERDIWIRLNGIQENRFSYFIQSRDSLEFLINEIKNKTSSRRQTLNCLFILDGFLELSETEKINVRDSLIPLMVEVHDDTYLSSVFIETFSKLKITDKITEDKFRAIYGHRKNQFIRGAMYSYISVLDEPDNWLDFLLEGIKIKVKRDREDREEVQNGSENITLENAFKSLKDKSSYLEILNQFYEDDLYESYFDFQDILKVVLKNSASLFPNSKSIFEKVFVLNSRLNSPWSHEFHELFLNYFEQTKNIKNGFNKALKLNKPNLSPIELCEMTTFLTDGTINILKQFIASGEIPFEAAESLYYNLRHFNSELSENLKEIINKSSGKIIKNNHHNGPSVNESYFHKKLFPWFKIDELIKDINQILKGMESIDLKYLNTYLYKGKLGDINQLEIHHHAKKIIRELAFSRRNSIKDILGFINNKNRFQDYLVDIILHEIHMHDPEKFFNPDQIKFLKTWFENNVDTIDFNNLRILGGNIDINQVSKAKNLTFLYEAFSFPCTDKVKLDMLGFCNDTYDSFKTVSMAKIINEVGRKKVENRIAENISKRRIKNSLAIRCHIKYIFKHKMDYMFEEVFTQITENGKEKSNLAELNDFFSANNHPKVLYKYFDYFAEQDQIYILDQIKNDAFDEDLANFLKHVKSSQKKSKDLDLAVSKLHLRLKKLEGLEMIINWIKVHLENPFYPNDIDLANSNDIKVLPYLIELLNISYNKSIGNNVRFNTIWSTVKKGLINLASVSNEYASEIIAQLENFISENIESIADVKYNYDIIEDIKSNLLNERLKVKSYKVRDCVLLYEEVF